MPIPINSLEMGPLAALAAQHVGNLNIQAAPIDWGAVNKGIADGKWKGAQLKEKYDELANNILNTQIQNEGNIQREQMQQTGQNDRNTATLATQQNIANQNIAQQQAELKSQDLYRQGMLANDQDRIGIAQQGVDIDRQQMVNTNKYNQGMLNNDTARVGLQGEKQASEERMNQFKAMMALDAQKRDEIGAWSAAFATGAQMAKTPEEFEKFKATYLPLAVKKKLITQEEADRYAAMNPTELVQQSLFLTVGTQYAKGMIASQNKKASDNNQPLDKVSEKVNIAELSKSGEEAEASRNIIGKLQTLETLDNTNKVANGQFANFTVAGKKGAAAIGQLFGVNVNPGTAESEAYQAVSTDLQLDYQTKLKGATSDRDLDNVRKALPQLNNTTQGRKLMYNWGIATETAKEQRYEFQKEWAMNHNGNLSGSQDAWESFIKSDSRVNKDTGKFDIDKFKRDSWKPFLNENYKPEPKSEPVSEAPSSNDSGLVDQVIEYNKSKGINITRERAQQIIDTKRPKR